MPLTSFTVNINGSANVAVSQAIPVVLDSGTTLTYLPSKTVAKLYKAIDAEYDENYGLAYVDCKYLSQNLTFAFQFGSSDGPIVSVPADEVIFDNVQQFEDAGYDVPSDLGFDNVCTFGILPSDDYYLLGDTFLRSAYVVYDLQNQQIAIAQANLNSTDSNIIEISNSTTQLPDVTGVASQVSVTQTATGLPGVGGGSGGTSTTVPTGTATPNASVRVVPTPDWPAVMAAVLTGVGICVGGILTMVV